MIKLAGQDIVHMNAKALSKLRKDTIGFVFQDYSLLDSMSLLDNIVLPLSLNGAKAAISLKKGKRLARQFGLLSIWINILINFPEVKNNGARPVGL